MQAIELELGMCVDELKVLQSKMEGKRREYDYRLVLGESIEELKKITILIKDPVQQAIVKYIIQVLNKTQEKLKTKDIDTYNGWESTQSIIRTLNSHISVVTNITRLLHNQLWVICKALTDGIKIPNTNNSTNNDKMLELMSNTGTLLKQTQSTHPNLYDSIGPDVSTQMKRVVEILTKKYGPPLVRQ